MNKTDTRRFRQILESLRDETVRMLDRLEDERRGTDGHDPHDDADSSVASLSKQALFQQSSQQRRLARKIDSALLRLNDGSFGVCMFCGEDIHLRRLEALPWSQYCLRCQEEIEQGGAPNAARSGLAWRRSG
jgi:DnaK suppressor protein